MNTMKYNRDITALLVIDPYNDFISEGGKVWDRLRGVAEANNCIPHMTAVLDATRAATCALCASSSLPPRRLRNLEVHCARSEGRVVTKDLRRHNGQGATADYSDEAMHAALDVNIPNYANAVVTTSELVESISSLAEASAQKPGGGS